MDSLPFISFAQTLVNPALKESFSSTRFPHTLKSYLPRESPLFGAAPSGSALQHPLMQATLGVDERQAIDIHSVNGLSSTQRWEVV